MGGWLKTGAYPLNIRPAFSPQRLLVPATSLDLRSFHVKVLFSVMLVETNNGDRLSTLEYLFRIELSSLSGNAVLKNVSSRSSIQAVSSVRAAVLGTPLGESMSVVSFVLRLAFKKLSDGLAAVQLMHS